jgi:hypothetical protein
VVWHAGATPGYFAHLVLAPGSRLGVIVLANVYSPAADSALTAAAFNLVRMLQGGTPRPASTDPALAVALGVLSAVAALLLAGLICRRHARSAAVCRGPPGRLARWPPRSAGSPVAAPSPPPLRG